MDEAEVVAVARREAYRVVSIVVFIFNLLLLLATAFTLQPWIDSSRRSFADMGWALPSATRAVLSLEGPIALANLGLIAAMIVKEIYASPKARLWLNVISLLLLLGLWAFCVWALRLPMMRAMQGQ